MSQCAQGLGVEAVGDVYSFRLGNFHIGINPIVVVVGVTSAADDGREAECQLLGLVEVGGQDDAEDVARLAGGDIGIGRPLLTTVVPSVTV